MKRRGVAPSVIDRPNTARAGGELASRGINHGVIRRTSLSAMDDVRSALATDHNCNKFGQSLDSSTLPFLQNFNGLLFGLAL